MSNDTWDWWFGDGPLKRTRTKRRRRIALAAGFTLTLVTTAASWLRADDDSIESWLRDHAARRPAVFTMLDQDELRLQNSDRGSRTEVEQADTDEDRARRERLRQLLQRDPAEPDTEGKPSGQVDPGKQPADPARSDDPRSADRVGALGEPTLTQDLPEVAGGVFRLPPLRAVSTDTGDIGSGVVPEDFAGDQDLRIVPLPEDAYTRAVLSGGLPLAGTVLPWAAPNTFSHPLYFEDRMLERHGHERWGCLQPIAGGARFFMTVPMLPYLATIQEPCDIVYSKGYFRTGSPVPRFLQRPPYERRAALVEAASIAGGMIALP